MHGKQSRVNHTDYPELVDNSSEVTGEDTVDCSKLILTEPYNGEEYSIILKRRASTTDLYNIISRIEIEKLNDESLSFIYHHATRKALMVTMNTKALELVSKCYTYKRQFIHKCNLHIYIDL